MAAPVTRTTRPSRRSGSEELSDEVVGGYYAHPDSAEIRQALVGDLGHRVPDHDGPEVALTGVEQRRPGTVGQVASDDDYGVAGVQAEPILEPGAVEGTPPWLEEDNLR